MSNWISVDEKLPENGQMVMIFDGNAIQWKSEISVAVFYKGRTAEEMKKLSFGTIYGCDEYGNNKKPYNWHCPHSHMVWFGQYVTHWMPLPEPPKEVEDDG